MDVAQAPYRIGLVARQIDEHEGDLVAELALLPRVAHVHGHHGLEPDGILTLLPEELPNARRGDTEQDVVQLHVERALDLKQVVEGPREEAQMATRGDRRVELPARGGGPRRIQQCGSGPTGAIGCRGGALWSAGDARRKGSEVELGPS